MREHTISDSMVDWILSGARERGHEVAGILRRADIASPTGQSRRVPRARYAALLNTLKRVMRDELWGLCSRPVPPGTFAATCWAVIHCSNLREALTVGLACYRRLAPELHARLHAGGTLATVTLNPVDDGAGPLPRIAQSVFLFHVIQQAWWLTGRRFPLRELACSHASVIGSDETPRLLNTYCRYAQPRASLSFDARWLDLPVMQTRDSLRSLLRDAPDSLLIRHREAATTAAQVRTHLSRQLPLGAISLAAVADCLNLTEATLNRRLRSEGTSFQDIKDTLRHDESVRYLECTDLPVSAIAQALGFSEPATFCRAFKKWTGLAPGQYRRGARPWP
ncbi:AraC family transcriptional regulator ligand-binding domain-containing protein [Cupriavidus alkaliphilus]|uniref:AraC family transcriptional regulator ligand-binding domain-containing protein n=1 Tax=Cupriavidus alkaliphilus TaxID=942866 RepID=UPI00160FFBAC|nr:AraC-like DNA-binding protein [Cupriavidus alkaliphilus]